MTGVLRSILSISAATVLSRVTGYVRLSAQAAVLGVGVVADAYALAILLPSLIYELFLGGILYSIFIPVLVDRMTSHGGEDARRLTSALFTLVLPLMALLTLLGVIFAGPLVALVGAWSPSGAISPTDARRTTDLAVLLFRIFALQMLFYGVSTIATGVLQAHRRFFLPTFAPVLNNLIIVASFVAYFFLQEGDRETAVYVLALGVTVGVAVMALALVPTMLSLGYRPRPQLGHPALLPTARLAGPMVVLVAASVGFQLLAARLATGFGAYAELTYAFTVFSLPYGIFVVAIATALMPELSEKHSRGDVEDYRDTLSFGLRTIVFVVVPSTVGLVVLAEPIVGVLYQRLNFGPEATQRVATLLIAYSVGLLGYSAYFFLVRAFYSRQNTKTPAILNVGILFAYAALAYGLSYRLGAVGVVLALSIAYAVLALLALGATRREIGRIDGRHLLTSLAKILTAGGAMYAVSLAGTALLGGGSDFTQRLLVLVAVGGVSLAAYLGVAFLLGTEELKSVAGLFRRRPAA
ncbi:MAG: Proposed peptidoglycan lipid II flippase MurJ [uncultured Rubrobacteraceae bacterium]|uniref:Probable lipid II flippase MurJ n=1 Tax=uncultured Rubrobacteraceae bacterium TaxID=349277 RepID=A0A6J4PBH7_9ACTN|nr:MAG: Proposed peptidoglycan lipid II flippase MurJ [uncultured Rubrobacteraceae bacterium]